MSPTALPSRPQKKLQSCARQRIVFVQRRVRHGGGQAMTRCCGMQLAHGVIQMQQTRAGEYVLKRQIVPAA